MTQGPGVPSHPAPHGHAGHTGGKHQSTPDGCQGNDAAIDAAVERFNALPILDARTDDAIIGYDENGLPSR